MNRTERIVERVNTLIPAQPQALRVCAYARVSAGKDAMLHSLSAQVSYYFRKAAAGCTAVSTVTKQ